MSIETAPSILQNEVPARLSISQRLLNTRLGRFAVVNVAALGLAASAATYETVNAEPAGAEDNAPTAIAPDLQQECADATLIRPEIIRPLVMRRAGIRIFTPGVKHSQVVNGVYGIHTLPDGSTSALDCTSEYDLYQERRLQMQVPHHRERWSSLEKTNGVIQNPLNQPISRGQYFWSPNHAWPDRLFNQCTDGKGWLKVRQKLTLGLRDKESKQMEEQKTFTLPVKVIGNCAAARRSKRLTKNLRSQWGH